MIIHNNVYVYTFVYSEEKKQGRIKVQKVERYCFSCPDSEGGMIVFDFGDDYSECYADEWEVFFGGCFKQLWCCERDDERAKKLFLENTEKKKKISSELIEAAILDWKQAIDYERALKNSEVTED